MHFSKVLEENVEYQVIACNRLDNNILLDKQKVNENVDSMVKLQEKQYAILFEKGKVLDVIQETGAYSIKEEPNSSFHEEFNDYQEKENNDPLCVIFFNRNTIVNNKFYLKKKHTSNFFGEGVFSFEIENPLKLFNKVIEVRNCYSREELLEQVRERIAKMSVPFLEKSENFSEVEEELIRVSDTILKEYGIKIVSCDMENIKCKKKL